MDGNVYQSIIALEMMAFMSTVEDPDAQENFKHDYTGWIRDRSIYPLGGHWDNMINQAESYGYPKHEGF